MASINTISPPWTAHGQNDLTSRHPEVDCITGQ